MVRRSYAWYEFSAYYANGLDRNVSQRRQQQCFREPLPPSRSLPSQTKIQFASFVAKEVVGLNRVAARDDKRYFLSLLQNAHHPRPTQNSIVLFLSVLFLTPRCHLLFLFFCLTSNLGRKTVAPLKEKK
jgi:hypothetical protein